MNNKWLSVATIFLGSFLVFGVQPMVGRTLLPVFGGTAAVWVVCLCAFQVLLLAGYWVADWLVGRGRAEARPSQGSVRIRLHVGLLRISSLCAPEFKIARIAQRRRPLGWSQTEKRMCC